MSPSTLGDFRVHYKVTFSALIVKLTFAPRSLITSSRPGFFDRRHFENVEQRRPAMARPSGGCGFLRGQRKREGEDFARPSYSAASPSTGSGAAAGSGAA